MTTPTLFNTGGGPTARAVRGGVEPKVSARCVAVTPVVAAVIR